MKAKLAISFAIKNEDVQPNITFKCTINWNAIPAHGEMWTKLQSNFIDSYFTSEHANMPNGAIIGRNAQAQCSSPLLK